MSTSGYRERNSTADRTLTILGMFTEDRLQITANEVADELGSARSTAYRYLQTLVSNAFLEEAPGGGFRMGFRILELARLARQGYGLLDLARPVMRELAAEVGETVLLTRRVDDAVVCIDRHEVGGLVRLSYERGTRLPLNAGASALALLAWLPEDKIRELLTRHRLEKFTENTIADVDELVGFLGKVREDGWVMTPAWLDPDTVGVAAPIFDENGDVEAAISVAAMRRRLSDDRLPAVIAAVRVAAEALSRQVAIVGH